MSNVVSNIIKELSKMTLISCTKKENLSKTYAKDRVDLRRITRLSDSAITLILRAVKCGKIYATKNFIIRQVEIDESSLKEAAE